MPHRLIPTGLTAAALAALYALCAGRFSTSEAIAGLVASLPAIAYAARLHRTAGRHFEPRPPWRRLIASTIRSLLRDTPRVALALTRRDAGVFTRQPFDFGPSTPTDAARRGLTTLALSLAPNSYAVRIGADAIVLHQLCPQPARADCQWPL